MLGILEHIMLKGKAQTEKLGHTRHEALWEQWSILSFTISCK
jgi:hypothetical protein